MASLKRLLYIFIPVFAILLMSHNTSAFSMVIDYSDYDKVYSLARAPVDCTINGTNYINQGFCTSTGGSGNTSLTKLITNNAFTVKSGDIVNFKVVVFSPNNFVFNFGTSYINNQSDNGQVIGFNEIIDDDLTRSYASNGNLNGGNYISRVYEYFIQVYSDSTTYHAGLNSSAVYPILSWYSESPSDILNFKIVDLNVFRYKGSGVNSEQKQETQNAANDSQTAGTSSSQDATTATSSLISVIGGFVNVLTSATPTNCKINADLNHIDIGQLDLCANPVPSYIQIIGSIILICVAIPLAIVLFNRFIGLFRSFQG